MLRLLGRRLAFTIPLLLVVTFLIYSLVVLVPGDPAVALAGANPTPEQIATVRQNLGLNDPFLVRYWGWLSNAFHGDLGTSLFTHVQVWDSIMTRLPVTLSLTFLAMLFAAIFGLALGLVAGLRPGSWIDRFATIFASIGIALPYFWVGMVLVLLFAINTRALPAVGFVGITDNPLQWFLHLLLPAFSLSLASMAVVARQTRASVVNVMSEDYIRTADAKGLSRMRVVGKHALKNASIPVVTSFGIEITRLIGGTVVIEQLFVLPGLGQLIYQSVFQRDFPTVQGVLLFVAVMVLLVNLIVDVSYGYFNPRIRQS